MSKRVFIVGANGFVGSRAMRQFLAAGWQVHAFGPPGPPSELVTELRARYTDHIGSFTQAAELATALRAAAPDVVVSFAAHSVGGNGLVHTGEIDPHGTLTVNVAGYHNLFECCRAQGVRRIVWTSSTSVFGPARLYPAEPLDENAPPHPFTLYGLSKVMLEALARHHRDKFGLEICAVRPPLVIGPGRWYVGAAGALMQLFQAAAARRSVSVHAAPDAFDLIYGDDLARAVVQLCEHPRTLAECYHVNGFATTHHAVAEALTQLVPDCQAHVAAAPAADRHPLMSDARVRSDIGFQPQYDLPATCSAYVDALRKQGDQAP